MSALIEMRKIAKSYRGAVALKDVDFTLEEGEIHALVGENGAGKSTLTQDHGRRGRSRLVATMLFEGKPVAFRAPAEALAAGIAMVFQETSLVPSMTVAQNLYLGEEPFFNRLRGAAGRGAAIPRNR